MSSDALSFQKLTPISNAELGVYGKALNFVFSNDDIKNIAISGAYSAGKSSILETYKKSNPNKKFLHISLAHFKSPDAEEKEIKETALEGKILNQLIHQINPCKIPQTNFRVKRDISSYHILFFTIFVAIFIISLTHIIFYDRWSKYIKEIQSQDISNWLFNFFSTNESLLFSGTIIALLGIIFVYKLVSFFFNQSTFQKVNVQGTEIEIFKESDDSYFDKYLNEVLYLFENSEVDVIVFEDIDRYNSNQIFERLREINFLTNKHNFKKSKSTLRFFYLLRDDIFISKDRTKFFDFMIPVIPIIDGTNSYDSLLSIVIESGMQNTFTQNFLQGLSLYIDDMRILKNIFNEFLIYKSKLDTIELNPNKLLAIVSYKNIFPNDFSDLQLGKGFVANLFINKESFVKLKIEKIQKKIVETQEIIKKVEDEHLISVQEISILYKDRLDESRRYYNTETYQTLNKEIENRKKVLEIKNKDSGNALKVKLSILKEKISKLHEKKLCEIITRENIDSIFRMISVDELNRENNYADIKANEYFPLLKYLIRNGFLDETYSDYMTYFHAQSLSKEDKTFLRSIADKQAKDFLYNLRDVSKVISRLSVFDFDQAEVLNFDLLEHLLRTSTHRQYLDRIIEQLRIEKNYTFILGYFEQNRQRYGFTRELNSHWPELFSLMFNEGNFSKETIRTYSLLTIYNSSDDVINQVNLNSILTQYISEDSSYLDIDNPKIDRIISVFKSINISFVSLNYRESYKNIFRSVYSNDLYIINFDNISVILKNLYDAKSEEDIKTKNFSLIYRNQNSPLYLYILNNISIYIDMLINLKTTFFDDEEAFIFILNNEDIEIEKKVAYINTSSTVVLDIMRIESKELWEPLLFSQKVFPYSKNVINYFSHTFSYDKSLLAFMNGCNEDIDFSDHAIIDDIIQKFFAATVICNELNNDKYLSILKQVRHIYKTNPPDGINKDKIDILVELQILKMTKDMLIAMRQTYPDNIAKFILYNISEYVNIVDEEIYSNDEMLIVLSSHVDDKYKLSLLELEKEAVSIFQYKHSEDVIAYIITNNLELSEIQNIFDSYTTRSKKLKNIIGDMLEDNIDDIYEGKYTIPTQLYDDIFDRAGITVENKMKLFASLLPKLDKEKCKFYLQLLSFVDFSEIFTNKRPKFLVNDITEQILGIFKKKLWIRDFYVDSVDAGIFRVSKPRID